MYTHQSDKVSALSDFCFIKVKKVLYIDINTCKNDKKNRYLQ